MLTGLYVTLQIKCTFRLKSTIAFQHDSIHVYDTLLYTPKCLHLLHFSSMVAVEQVRIDFDLQVEDNVIDSSEWTCF